MVDKKKPCKAVFVTVAVVPHTVDVHSSPPTVHMHSSLRATKAPKKVLPLAHKSVA